MTQNIKNDNKQTNIQFTVLLKDMATHLAAYLDKALPKLYENWWREAVIDSLSFQQKKYAEKEKIDSLSSLDLATLSRVLDMNWHQISTTNNLQKEQRHYVKEMQTIHNKWAHVNDEAFQIDDLYRALNTMHRFAQVIEADESFIQNIEEAKKILLEGRTKAIISGKKNTECESSLVPDIDALYEPGQIVFLKSNPNTRGAIVSVIPGEPESRYKVFIDGRAQTFYASQLGHEELKDGSSHTLPYDEFQVYLTALQIRHPGLSTLYSMNAARIDFIPYQFRPVLKFIRSDRPRLLIADGVGVGKTIEAGLILRELQARRDIRSILIICPRPLVTERKWQIEMKRFEEKFIHIDGPKLRFAIKEMDLDGVWPEQYQKIILPYSLFDESLLYGTVANGKKKLKKGLLDLDPPPRFDLVIVDEAHHIRNINTFSHKAVRFFCDNAEAVVFLTATPIQLGNQDLYVLLNVLRPDLIIDRESFEHMAEPNPHINEAVTLARTAIPGWNAKALEALDEAASTSWGKVILRQNPKFRSISQQITQDDMNTEQRVQLISEIEILHTFSGIINRTRRRDIGEFTVRKPETVIVEFTPSQKSLHDKLLQIQAEIFKSLHGDINVKFMMTTIRRQAASCLYGLVPFLYDILNRHIDELTWEEADDSMDAFPEYSIDTLTSRIQSILEEAQNLDPADPKLEALIKIISQKQDLPNNKIMVFSSFRHTLHYLFEKLKNEKFRIGLVHGGTPDEERVEYRNRFELDRKQQNALDVLLFSEVGCEGLDYQFCDCIVNYDLPWNPMRIEQRIGRIDRWGQRSESVVIFNLITPGTVDADIYERCLLRIGVFKKALGGSEEILGEISREIRSIAENFSLTDSERREKLQQLSDNKIRHIQEQEELEEKQVELFGIRLPNEQLAKEIEEASNFWLSSDSIRNLITLYLNKTCGKEQEPILGEKPLKTLRLSQEARNRLLMDFKRLPRQNSSMYRDWERWLKGGNPHLLITFEASCASQNPDAAFMMPLHSLVRQAANAFDIKERVLTTLQIKDDKVPSGKYLFAIYQWQFCGIRDDIALCPVANSEVVTTNLNKLLEKGGEDSNEIIEKEDLVNWNALDSHHYKIWHKAREQHRDMTMREFHY